MPGDAVNGFFVAALGLPPRAPLAPAEQALGAVDEVPGMPPPARASSRWYGTTALAASQADRAAGLWPWPLAPSQGGAPAGPAPSAPGMSVRGEASAAAPSLALPGDVLAEDALARLGTFGYGPASPSSAGKGQPEPPAADSATGKLPGASGLGTALAPVPGVSAALPAGVQVHIGPVAGSGLLGGSTRDAAPRAPVPAFTAQAAANGPAAVTPAAPVAVAGQDVLASPRPTPAALPLDFEANVGQVGNAAVQFLTHGPGYTLYLTATQAVFALRQPSAAQQQTALLGQPLSPRDLRDRADAPPPAVDLLTVQLVGANPSARAVGQDLLQARSNYFLGNDPRQWHTDVPNYGRVEFPGIYPGVDLVYHNSAAGQQAESDFVVAPGADPGAIRLAVEGAQSAQLDGQGNLVLTTANGGRLVQQAPALYQDGAGGRQMVAGAYVPLEDGQFGFRVGGYDRSRPLVIDPVLTYSSYLGGSGTEEGWAVAADAAGNTYVTGYTNSNNFPTRDPFQGQKGSQYYNNVFVTKVDAAGNLVYSTYLGGSGQTAGDLGTGIAVDAAGDAYVTGLTYSYDFPLTQNPLQDTNKASYPHFNGFVSKLNPAGSALLYSTYLGGSGSDRPNGIAVDRSGYAYVAGWTDSGNFPLKNALQGTKIGRAAFVTKLDPSQPGSLSLVYSTYLDGGAFDEAATAIAVDTLGDTYVTGDTTSRNFPTFNAIQSTSGVPPGNYTGFVTELNAAGSARVFSTYLGGSLTDGGTGIAVDASGNAYVTGYTYATGFHTYAPSPYTPFQATNPDTNRQSAAFVTKFNGTSGALLYSTYLGGSGDHGGDAGQGIAVDAAGNAYITGYTGSTDFPTQNPLPGTSGGGVDAFVTKLNAAGSGLVYSTRLGGSGSDTGYGIAVDAAGNAHVAGDAGSPDFPTKNPFQGTANGSDAFVAVIGVPPLAWQGPSYTWTQTAAANPSVTTPANQTSAEGDNVSLPLQASDPDGYPLTYDAVDLPPGLRIDRGTGLISGTVDYQAAEDFGGVYHVTVIVANNQGGSSTRDFTWTITDSPRPPLLTNPGSQTNAPGDSVSLQVRANQPDGDQLLYDATNLPPGLNIDNFSGLISGTVGPGAATAGPYTVTVTATDETPAQPLSGSQTFTWTILAGNQTPVLTNPGPRVNAAGDGVDLAMDGRDADGDPLTYTATGLPAGLNINPVSGAITGVLANAAASATPYTVTVRASDGMTSASQTFPWTVNAVGLSNPGDQNNSNGDVVSLPLTGSDASGLSLTYSAIGLPPGLSIDSGSGLIAGTLSNTADADSPYAVTVTATDGTNSASQTFAWAVAHVGLTNPGDQISQEGTAVSLPLTATDPGGSPTYSATGLPAGVGIDPGTGLISGTLGVATHGSSPYRVTVTATDGPNSVSQAFTWTVTPRVALVNPGNQGNAAGDTVSLQVAASTVGGTLTYGATGLPQGLTISGTTGLIAGTIDSGAVSATPYTVTVTANDGTSTSSQTFPWTVSTVYVVPPGNQTSLDGDSVSLAVAAHYQGTGTLSYSATGLPPGLAINTTTGLISGTLSGTTGVNSPYTVTVTATDGPNSGSQTLLWTVNPLVAVDPVSARASAAGDTVALAVSATDALNHALSFTASGLPPGLSISSSTGIIAGTIAVGADASGPYVVTVTATDGSVSASQTFNWAVGHIYLANPGARSDGDGASVSLALQGHDADGEAVTYTASGLPAGLTIDNTTGVISGTIGTTAHAGSPYRVTVTATDGPHTASQTFLWTVTQVGVANPGDQTNVEGDAVSLQVAATTPSGTGPLSYYASGLPAGLSIDPSTGLISGTVAPGAQGVYPTTVVASNGAVSSSQAFTWTVNPQVTVTAPPDQSNQEGDTVSLPIQATDAGHASLTYAAKDLPAGLSIDSSTGLISGTIAGGAAVNGPYLVTVTAGDGTYSGSQTFSWGVAPAVAPPPPSLTNPGMQSSQAGDEVALPLPATSPGGYALTYSATGLPDGLDINPSAGRITGIVADGAVRVTPYRVTVTAADGVGGTASQTFLWVVNPSPITAQVVPINAVEGNDTGGITVATFTTPDTAVKAGDWTATVTWGDGTSDRAAVTGAEGSFTVTGAHVYAGEGSYPVRVVIGNPYGATTTVSGTATVADAGLTLTGGFDEGVLVGQTATVTLALLTDANPGASGSDYTVAVNWGDGGTGSGQVTAVADGMFTVTGGHVYASDGTYTVQVTVTDAGGASATTTSTVSVGDLYAGLSSSLVVASFTDSDPSASASDYAVTINWGDGSSSPGTVSGSAGNFSVHGSHTYTADSQDQPGGTYRVTVTVTNDDGSTLSGTTTAGVVRPPLAGFGDNLVASLGVAFSGQEVATFTDPDAGAAPAEFAAQVNWGDGSPLDPSAVVIGSGGLFQVLGSHTYASAGTFPVTVEVQQRWAGLYAALPIELTALVVGRADLSITQDDGKAAAVPGTSDTYTITVTNNGPGTVGSLTLTDTLPAALLNPVFGTPSAGSYDATTHVWSGLSLASGQSVRVTVSGTVNPAATGSMTNTVTVAPPAGVADISPANNSASDTDSIDALPVVYVGGNVTVDAGDGWTRSNKFFTDPNFGPWTATVNYGDGSGTQPLALSGQTFNLGHTWSNPGTYTVTVTVTDDVGAVGTASLTVTVDPLS